MIDLSDVFFVDIDTQYDFIMPDGSLYVPGAEKLIPAMSSLVRFAREKSIPIVASVDAHTPDDPEFETWPPHCVKGTHGYTKIPETVSEPNSVVDNAPGDYKYKPGVQPIIESQVYSLFANPHADPIFAAIGRSHAVVFGVATDYCVKAACLGLRERGYKVSVVSDAIAPVAPDTGEQALKEMSDAGVEVILSADLLG